LGFFLSDSAVVGENAEEQNSREQARARGQPILPDDSAANFHCFTTALRIVRNDILRALHEGQWAQRRFTFQQSS
jgi:hypothetical protein